MEKPVLIGFFVLPLYWWYFLVSIITDLIGFYIILIQLEGEMITYLVDIIC